MIYWSCVGLLVGSHQPNKSLESIVQKALTDNVCDKSLDLFAFKFFLSKGFPFDRLVLCVCCQQKPNSSLKLSIYQAFADYGGTGSLGYSPELPCPVNQKSQRSVFQRCSIIWLACQTVNIGRKLFQVSYGSCTTSENISMKKVHQPFSLSVARSDSEEENLLPNHICRS